MNKKKNSINIYTLLFKIKNKIIKLIFLILSFIIIYKLYYINNKSILVIYIYIFIYFFYNY